MSDSVTLRVDPGVMDRLTTLAAARRMDPADLMAELVFAAEMAQLVSEVNHELERLSQGPVERGRQRAEMRELEATVSAWMDD